MCPSSRRAAPCSSEASLVPHRAEHIRQAQQNAAHAGWLLRMQPSDSTTCQWATTALFYSAVHLIEVHFDRFSVAHTTHYDRNRDMADSRFGVPKAIDNAYKQLQRYS